MAGKRVSETSGKATALTAGAGKLVRDSALSAAHGALLLARKTVQGADAALRSTLPAPAPRKRKEAAAKSISRASRAHTKAVATKPPKRRSSRRKARPTRG